MYAYNEELYLSSHSHSYRRDMGTDVYFYKSIDRAWTFSAGDIFASFSDGLSGNLVYLSAQTVSENLYKEYTSLKSRELEELPRFVVMIWQPFMLLRSASLCLFRITLCMQRYDFVSYKTKVS